MRLELTRVGLQVKLANHYTTKGAQVFLFLYNTKYSFLLFKTKYSYLMQIICTQLYGFKLDGL